MPRPELQVVRAMMKCGNFTQLQSIHNQADIPVPREPDPRVPADMPDQIVQYLNAARVTDDMRVHRQQKEAAIGEPSPP